MHGWLVAAGVLAAAAGAVGWDFGRFRAGVRSALSATADIAWRRNTASGMVCGVWGYDLEVDLRPAYLDALCGRVDPASVAADLARALRGRVPPPAAPPFELVRDRLLPLLRRQDRLPPPDGYRPPVRLLRRRLDDEVAVIYVVEGLHHLTYVTEGMAHAWGVGLDGLHALACCNLRARTRHLLQEIGGPRADYVALDGYDAARLLVGEMLVPAGVDDPLLAVPHEHACLIGPSRQRDALARAARDLFARGHAPLTCRLYRPGPAGPVPA